VGRWIVRRYLFSGVSKKFCSKGVFNGPGQRELTRIPSFAWTIANSLDIARTAPFEAVSIVSIHKNLANTSYLRCSRPHFSNHTSGVDNTSSFAMFLHTLNSILTSPPNPFNIYIVRQIPAVSLLLPSFCYQIRSSVFKALSSSGCIIPALLKIMSTPPSNNFSASATIAST